MIAGLDSSTPPTLAAVKAAAAAGVTLWNGYIQTRPGLGLYRAWSRAEFEVARQAGSTPIAFCSGWDDPVAVKALALAWNVRLCVDIERGIRPDGAWKQAWLDASGAGIYGNYGCHNCRAAFHVLSAYPGSSDVQATWWSATPRPSGPCGWQWMGTHTEFGIGVDRGDYDDFFGSNSGDEMDQYSKDTNDKVTELWNLLRTGKHADTNPRWIFDELEALKVAIAKIQAGSSPLTDAQAGELTGIVQILTAHFQPVKGA